MSEKIKPVNVKALLSEVKGPKVYVSPTKGKVSNRKTEDSVAVPTTTWWRANSPLFSVAKVKEKIAQEATEMAVYFPDFKLYENESGEIFWLGSIDSIGELRITYPQTYPAQKFFIEALDQDESFNNELKQLVWSYNGITPAGSIVVAMRLFLLRKLGKR
jgi:hypothetical protein